jgi:thymidine kinase
MSHLTIICGCMFAQKTTELLRRSRKHQSIGKSVLWVNYVGDQRYGKNQIVSHDQDKQLAHMVERLEEVDDDVRSMKYDVVAIDEGQFFSDLYPMVTRWADELPLHILVAGLDGNSERQPFGDLLKLIPHAEEVKRLNAFCSVCADGTIAVYSQKFVSDKKEEEQEEKEIGGVEKYRPVCRKHYLKKVIESPNGL